VPLSIQQRLEVLDATELVFTPEQIDDQAKYLALSLVRDELPLIRDALDNETEYVPFVPIVALNGGVVMATRVFTYMSDHGVEVEPIFVNPSGYGTSQKIGDVQMNKGYTPEELKRISEGRVFYFDEGNDTGNTRRKVKDVTTELLRRGVLNFESEDSEALAQAKALYAIIEAVEAFEALHTGDEKSAVKNITHGISDGLENLRPGLASKVLIEHQYLRQPECFKSVFMWDKGLDKGLEEDPIDYLAATIPQAWEIGFGYDSALESGSSLGRYASILAISRQQPPAEE
jgi:hypoxanthine-guanine phosphoribosyltransferase